jgi:acetate kinase
VLRERICTALSYMGVALDPAANEAHAPVISAKESLIVVAVEPTNEEWIAALRAKEVVASGLKSGGIPS